MRTAALALSSLLLMVTVACGDSQAPDERAAPTAQPTSAPAATPSPEGEGQGEGEATVLRAVVGEPDDPNAFTIALTDESGEPVTGLPAGDYEIRVTDLSSIHNFHLTGEGVDESTGVPETGEETWQVSLEAGDYRYACDPHPSLTGTFAVT